MKRYVIIFIAFLLFASSVFAQSATDSSKEKLENLKDRLASAATQLQQSQRRAIFGTIKTVSVSTITVETATKDMKIELTDEITVAQVIKGEREELSTEDLAEGDTVTVFGDYDSTLDLLKAKHIFIQGTFPERIAGTITEVDKKGFTITVKTPDNISFIVDIETTTKNILWNKETGTSKGAFSKYAVGDIVFVLETAQKTANRVTGVRILDIGNPSGATPTPTPTKTSSPSATPKITPTP